MCGLNWNSKAFRGKAIKSKTASLKLVARLQELEEEERDDFLEGSHPKRVEFVTCSVKSMLSARPVHMPRYPESVPESGCYSVHSSMLLLLFFCRWYRDLCAKRHHEHWRPGPVNITAQTRVTPYLLRMKWKGHPLHFHAKLGWGYIISPDLQRGETPTFGDIESEW